MSRVAKLGILTLAVTCSLGLTAHTSAPDTQTLDQIQDEKHTTSRMEIPVSPESAALPASVACSIMTDWYLSCLCPGGYSAYIQGNIVGTPAMMWWSGSKSGMYNNRPPEHPWGMNPREYWSTGVVTYSTGLNGPVYFGPGRGVPADRWSWMDGICLSPVLTEAERERELAEFAQQHHAPLSERRGY